MSKKRVNPHRQNKPEIYWKTKGFRIAAILFFTILADDFGWSTEDMQKLWGKYFERAETTRKGYATLEDWNRVLKEERGIDVTMGGLK